MNSPGGAVPGQRLCLKGGQVHGDNAVDAASRRSGGKPLQSVAEDRVVVGHHNQRRIRDLLPHRRRRVQAVVRGYALFQGAKTGFLNDRAIGYRVAERYGNFHGVSAGGN